MKILIAEDDKVSAKLMSHILGKSGVCISAKDGDEALHLFYEGHHTNDPFDVILLDIMMPKMTGQEVLLAIRDFELKIGLLPEEGAKVIMITSYTDGNNLYEAHVSGCTDYLLKPVDKEKLKHILSKLGLADQLQKSDSHGS